MFENMKTIIVENYEPFGFFFNLKLKMELGVKTTLFSSCYSLGLLKIAKMKPELAFLDASSISKEKIQKSAKFIEKIKKYSPSTKIIALWTIKDDDDCKFLKEKGLDLYCPKDIETNELKKIIEKLFENEYFENLEDEREEILSSKNYKNCKNSFNIA